VGNGCAKVGRQSIDDTGPALWRCTVARRGSHLRPAQRSVGSVRVRSRRGPLPRETGATGDVGDGTTQVREMSRRSALVFRPRSHRRAGTRAETTCPTAGYRPPRLSAVSSTSNPRSHPLRGWPLIDVRGNATPLSPPTRVRARTGCFARCGLPVRRVDAGPAISPSQIGAPTRFSLFRTHRLRFPADGIGCAGVARPFVDRRTRTVSRISPTEKRHG
jgi:hypothetical protein